PRDRLRELFQAVDRLAHGPVDDLVDRLEIARHVRPFLVRRQVDKQIEGGRQRDGSIGTTDLDGFDNAGHADPVEPERVRDLLALYVLRAGIDAGRFTIPSAYKFPLQLLYSLPRAAATIRTPG